MGSCTCRVDPVAGAAARWTRTCCVDPVTVGQPDPKKSMPYFAHPVPVCNKTDGRDLPAISKGGTREADPCNADSVCNVVDFS